MSKTEVFRRQLYRLKKLIEIFTMLFWGLISLSNTYVDMKRYSYETQFSPSSEADNTHLRHLHLRPHRTDSYKLYFNLFS